MAAYENLIDLTRLQVFLNNLESQGGGGETVLLDTVQQVPEPVSGTLYVYGVNVGDVLRFEFCSYRSTSYAADDSEPICFDTTVKVPSGTGFYLLIPYHKYDSSGTLSMELFKLPLSYNSAGKRLGLSTASGYYHLFIRRIVKVA